MVEGVVEVGGDWCCWRWWKMLVGVGMREWRVIGGSWGFENGDLVMARIMAVVGGWGWWFADWLL